MADWALVRIRRVLCLVSKFVNAKMYSRGSVERSGTKERERWSREERIDGSLCAVKRTHSRRSKGEGARRNI